MHLLRRKKHWYQKKWAVFLVILSGYFFGERRVCRNRDGEVRRSDQTGARESCALRGASSLAGTTRIPGGSIDGDGPRYPVPI